MKVGIMTFHSSHNCGSMLQAYALQHTLEERYGADAELINFANQGSRNLYGMIDFRPKKQAIHNTINNFKHYKLMKRYHQDYIDFMNKYLKVSQERYLVEKQLRGCEKGYDLLVSGGDQVWNVKWMLIRHIT